MTGQSPILVTGATSGLGREIALQLAARGERVIASGRRTDRLAELAAQENIQPLKLDLLKHDNIQVSVFAPGGIKTEMTDIPAMTGLERQLAPAADIAAAAIETYDKMPALAVPGLQNKLVAGASKLLPRANHDGLPG